MPPLRSARASKACELCRKYKTRCYASEQPGGPCLRCQTLSERCSLLETAEPALHRPGHGARQRSQRPRADAHDSSDPGGRRLDRLERMVESLVERLNARPELQGGSSNRETPQNETTEYFASIERDQAPVMMIRDAATDAGVNSTQRAAADGSPEPDVIMRGLITLSAARSLLKIFHVHYGRWVRFPDSASTDEVLARTRQTPLLICSVLLIAVRHSTQDLADKLAPLLFQEARRLLASSLLDVSHTMEFFQAALILSLWSTTIGQVPLSIDSWLLTGYAIQQGLASPVFKDVLRPGANPSASGQTFDAWCLWNHICLAHLQYCVGTRRHCILKQAQIDHCLQLVGSDHVTNYETRMAGEVELYWIIYQKCCGAQVNLVESEAALQDWRKEWVNLFNQPRSQFLQMGFHFAHLLAHFQSLKSPKSVMSTLKLSEMIRLSTTIINLAIDKADDRTRHLTDHIYHLVTFSALTLTQIVYSYESKLRATKYSVEDLDNLVLTLIRWFRSIGLPCHVSHMLSDALVAQFAKLRPASRLGGELSHATRSTRPTKEPDAFAPTVLAFDSLNPQTQTAYPYVDYIGSEMFGMDVDLSLWPEWNQVSPHTDFST